MEGVEVKYAHIAVVIGEKIVERGGERIVGDGFGQLLDDAFFVFNAERVEKPGEQDNLMFEQPTAKERTSGLIKGRLGTIVL